MLVLFQISREKAASLVVLLVELLSGFMVSAGISDLLDKSSCTVKTLADGGRDVPRSNLSWDRSSLCSMSVAMVLDLLLAQVSVLGTLWHIIPGVVVELESFVVPRVNVRDTVLEQIIGRPSAPLLVVWLTLLIAWRNYDFLLLHLT